MKKLVIHPKDRSTDFLKPIYHGRNDTTVITEGRTTEEVNEAIAQHDHIIMLGHGTPQGLLAMGNFNKKPAYTPKPSTAIRAGKTAPVSQADIKSLYKATGAKPYVGAFDDYSPDDGDDDDWFTNRKVQPATTYGGYQGSYQSLSTGYIINDDTADLLRNKKLTSIWCNADQYMEWNDLEGFYTGMFISEESEATMIGTADTDKWQVEESNYAFVSVVRRFLDHSSEKLRDALMLEYGEMTDRNAVAKYNLHRLYTRRAAQATMHTV